MINRMFSMADGCLVQVSPIDKHGQVYREYVFDEQGRFLIFDSLSGPYETSTAQQNYFLLPLQGPPTVQSNSETVTITLANGSQISFSKDSSYIASTSSDLAIEEKKEVSLQDGNLIFKKFPGILLNAGWQIGERKYRDPSAASIFSVMAENGVIKNCSIVNEQIFQYVNPVTREPLYQPILRYTDEASLRDFLAQCYF